MDKIISFISLILFEHTFNGHFVYYYFIIISPIIIYLAYVNFYQVSEKRNYGFNTSIWFLCLLSIPCFLVITRTLIPQMQYTIHFVMVLIHSIFVLPLINYVFSRLNEYLDLKVRA